MVRFCELRGSRSRDVGPLPLSHACRRRKSARMRTARPLPARMHPSRADPPDAPALTGTLRTHPSCASLHLERIHPRCAPPPICSRGRGAVSRRRSTARNRPSPRDACPHALSPPPPPAPSGLQPGFAHPWLSKARAAHSCPHAHRATSMSQRCGQREPSSPRRHMPRLTQADRSRSGQTASAPHRSRSWAAALQSCKHAVISRGSFKLADARPRCLPTRWRPLRRMPARLLTAMPLA